MMRFASYILVVIIAAGLGWWFVLRHDPEMVARVTGEEPQGFDQAMEIASAVMPEPLEELSPRAAAPEAVPVLALAVEAESASERLTLRGRTEANRHVEVRAETAGRVTTEPLRAGTRVEAGALLCRLEPGAREALLAEAEAALAEARAEADAADRLSEKGFTAETTRIARRAALQRAQAELDLVRLDLARLEMRAPFAGVLESDTAELGARLGVGDACATVIDLSEVKVTAFVSEQDVDRLAEGQRVTVRLISGVTREGQLDFIGRMADSDTRTYRVEARLANPDGALRDGMTAELTVNLPTDRAHRIPQAALTLDDTGALGVRVAEDGRAVFYPVRILRDEADGAWVTGLPESAQVIVVGQEFVRDGRAVQPTAIGWDDLG